MMFKSLLVVAAVLSSVVCLRITDAQAIYQGHQGHPSIIAHPDVIINKIKAEYEKLGGTSQHYPEEMAHYIDPFSHRIVP